MRHQSSRATSHHMMVSALLVLLGAGACGFGVAFGLEELTGRAYNVSAETFRSFEVFTMSAGLYVILTLVASVILWAAGRYLFRIKAMLV